MAEPSPRLGARFLRPTYRRLYGWAAERLYHELAWAYEAVAWLVSFGRWDAWRRQVLDHIVPGTRVLEVGFGTGALLAEASDRGLEVWGADPSKAMQRVAGRRLARHGQRPTRVRALAQALPFADGAFGTILSTFPTQYIADPAALREFGRLTSATQCDAGGGRVVVTGLGSRVESACLHRLFTLVFGGAHVDTVGLYAEFAEGLGFAVTVVDRGGQGVRVPVLVLQKTSVPDVRRMGRNTGGCSECGEFAQGPVSVGGDREQAWEAVQ
jgi:SAM-dependent methyltransferase